MTQTNKQTTKNPEIKEGTKNRNILKVCTCGHRDVDFIYNQYFPISFLLLCGGGVAPQKCAGHSRTGSSRIARPEVEVEEHIRLCHQGTNQVISLVLGGHQGYTQ